MSDEYSNLLTNVILPVDPRRTDLLIGSLEYVAFEVVVAKIIRKVMRMDNVGWTRLAYIHTLSLPFLGGAAGFFDPAENYRGQNKKGEAIGFADNIFDGAKGIPAVLLAQWILDSFAKGFHAPWFNMKDLLVTAGTKALTRPVIGFLSEYLPDTITEKLAVVDEMIRRQQSVSTLRSSKKAS